MRIGDLKKRITLQSETKTADGMGGFSAAWGDEVTVWGAIWPLSSSERLEAMKMSGEITHRIRIRYRSGLESSWRIKYGDRYFAIIGPPINPNEKNEILDILCKEASA